MVELHSYLEILFGGWQLMQWTNKTEQPLVGAGPTSGKTRLLRFKHINLQIIHST
jgi:hypothetical protein